MKIFYSLLLLPILIFTIAASSISSKPVNPASQAEVDTGTNTTRYVTPATLAGWTGAGTNTMSGAQITNAAAYQAYLATNGFFQPLDSDLTSIAAQGTTAFGRGLLDDADAAAGRTSLGVVIGTDVQAFDADLTDLADGSLTGTKVGTGIAAGNITSGTVPTAQLGSGTANSSSFLRGDSTWAMISGSSGFPLTANADVAGYAVSNIYHLRGRDAAGVNGEVWLITRSGNSFLILTNEGGSRFGGHLHVDGAMVVDGGLDMGSSAITAANISAAEGSITNLKHASFTSVMAFIDGNRDFTNSGTSAFMRTAIEDESGTGVAIFAGGNIAAGTATTASANDNDTSIATTAYVQTELTAYGSDTVTFTGKTFDTTGTGNVLKFKQYLYFRGFDMATGALPVNTNDYTAITYMKPEFLNGTDKASNYVEWRTFVPEDIDTGVALRARVKVRLTAADTASHRYVLSFASVADSASAAGTPGTEINLDFAGDASGASGDVETVAWTTLTSWAAGLTAGQEWVIRLARDGDTSDASTVNSQLMECVIEYGATQ